MSYQLDSFEWDSGSGFSYTKEYLVRTYTTTLAFEKEANEFHNFSYVIDSITPGPNILVVYRLKK